MVIVGYSDRENIFVDTCDRDTYRELNDLKETSPDHQQLVTSQSPRGPITTSQSPRGQITLGEESEAFSECGTSNL